jgi:hypothetical protein
MGYRKGRARARVELRAMFDELTELQDDVSAISNDCYRFKCIAAAIATERPENVLLN